ncbi:MAG: RnfABCDGE type electron transport complex subunit B [Coxiellaceae bacterium]|nr:MAG: RnfABCDGE type electron transport complex subunit B [Coxiellaceae bacterium]
MSKLKSLSVVDIDAVLPQTQCGLCNYAGCKPYATAILEQNAPINLCPPGGVTTLINLAELTGQDAGHYLDEMQQKAKPPQKVVIREAECIGCTKCIQACPVDAIVGAPKLMHTVIADACTGCELCLPPCPMDCIDIVPLSTQLTPLEQIQQANKFRQRFQAREQRLGKQQATLATNSETLKMDIIERQQEIAAAVARAKAKKRGHNESQ